jgi:hypothetical protein
LSFKTQVGTNCGPTLPDKLNSLLESPAFLLHEIGDNQRSWLNIIQTTLEIPAAQCTSTFPLEILF